MIHFKKVTAVVALAILPCTAFSTPTVTFEGEVTDQTCSVSINGQTNSVVMLPTVATADFGATLANGQTAGLTPFTVSVSECTAPAADLNISTKFMGYDVDSSTGVLGNRATTDAAVGYGIQLTGSSDGSDVVTLSGPTNVSGLVLKTGETSASYDFGAQYYVIDATSAKPGKITAVAEYTLSYF
ncbi:type 1 fimbrial protein [Enterobacteriaceae bacterium 4M9]|nr:type 1 fimbrial protein [Enterobacteriaceae bacterium 4M9]